MINKFSVINVKIPARQTSVTVDNKKIRPGNVVAMCLHTSQIPSSAVELKIQDDGDNEVHPLVSHLEYKPTGGGHTESRKQIAINGDQILKVTATSKIPLDEEFNFQLLFYIEDNI